MNNGRIGLLIVSLGKRFGGAERYTLNLMDALPKKQYDVHVAVRFDGRLLSRLDSDNVLMLHMGLRNLLPSIFKLGHYIKTNGISVVHCNGINAMILACVLGNVKKIAVIHGDTMIDHKGMGFLKEFIFPKLEILLICCFDECVAVSDSLKKLLVYRGAPKKRMNVVHNGIEWIKYSKNADVETRILRICNVGNLQKVKGQIYLLKALKYIDDHYPEIKYECDIFGEGECRQELQEYIFINKLDSVHLKGFDDKVRGRLNSYHIYVQPSLYESLGLSVLEAFNAGCYVIGSDVGGMREIFDIAEGASQRFPVGDYREIAHIIKRLDENRYLLEKGRSDAMENLKKEFSTQAMIEKLGCIYR